MYMPRGKVLGGGSSINGMAYGRGMRGDNISWPRRRLNRGVDPPPSQIQSFAGTAITSTVGIKPAPDKAVQFRPNEQAAETAYLSCATVAEQMCGISALPDGICKDKLTIALGRRDGAACRAHLAIRHRCCNARRLACAGALPRRGRQFGCPDNRAIKSNIHHDSRPAITAPSVRPSRIPVSLAVPGRRRTATLPLWCLVQPL